MNKVEKLEHKIHGITGEIFLLESDYEGRQRGEIYNSRSKSLKNKMDYHIDKLSKLGKVSVAIVDIVLEEVVKGRIGTTIERKKKITLVDLTHEEIDRLLSIRYPNLIKTYKVRFLVTGIV